MEEIEAGEWIRTDGGHIAKVTDVIYDSNDMNYYRLSDGFGVYEVNIVKHSKNLIDLIKIGDIVELKYYVAKYRKIISRKFECNILENKVIFFDNTHCSFCYDFELKEWRDGKGYNPKIKSILTKEQYQQNCYVVKEG